MRCSSGRRRLIVGAFAVLSALAALAAPVAAQSSDDAEQLRTEAVEAASKVDALRADATEVETALDTMSRDVEVQQDRLEDTRRSTASTLAALAAAQQRQQEASDRIEALNGQLRAVAVNAYVRPPTDDLGVVLGDDSPNDNATRKVLATTRVATTGEVVNQIRAERQRLTQAKAAAAKAVEAAQATQQAEQERLDGLSAATDRQRTLADDVQSRLDRALGEAAGIQSRSDQLAAEVGAREQELARKARAIAGGGSSSGSRPSWVSNGVSVTTVAGITVATSIAGALGRLLAAADADGVSLSGSGFRDIATQIELRREHCGTSDYAIWEMNSLDCSPPVARPGYSMHEQGLAVDFIVGGDLIRSRSSSGYRWLDANASDYGLYNLPSEPWHWSTTGS